MQLTGFTDLALRILMRLAVLEKDGTATTSALAEQLNVSYTHATKVVTALSALGVVSARRGRNGGLRLAVVECDGANPCPLRHGCRLRVALREAQEAFFAALDPLTIADVTARPTGPLLLSLSPRPEG